MKLHYSFLLLLLSAFSLKAQIIHIPSDQLTIQAGIDAATGSDTILVEEGTYFENINFLGKPVTVASRFIMDGDTSHISKTIIDGSQFSDWKWASTVLMESGEDTTSVLMGFTITGGEGTLVSRQISLGGITSYNGAGINIMNSGGKIVHNIIKGNHMTSKPGYPSYFGGGVNVSVNQNHTAIIRNNLIMDNSLSGINSFGAGISMDGGRCIVESNTIKGNKLVGEWIVGVGISWFHASEPETIEEVIIRNNLITENVGVQSGTYPTGGTIGTYLTFPDGIIEIYNNIISKNIVEGRGGGFHSTANTALVYNNTFYNNIATDGGNHISMGSGVLYLANNIVWSEEDNGITDIPTGYKTLKAYNNLLRPIFKTSNAEMRGNVFLEPQFKTGSFELSEYSPGIGRGIDSFLVDSIWFKAPALDFTGNPRPSEVDQFVDIGAIESDYGQPPYSNADLAILGMVGHSMVPQFHKDTLNYLLVKNSGNKIIGDWRIYAEDNLAIVIVDTAADLLSENELDRTTKILVTSSDGTAQKEYTVVYKYLSSVATLSSLEVGLGTLSPSFDPSVLAYYDTIPYGRNIPVPEITCTATDTSSTVGIRLPQDIYSQFEVMRTATIYVKSPNDVITQEYTILFTVDLTRPSLTLLNDSVEVGDSIGVTVSEPGTVYLVPENTPPIYDSILNVKLTWAESGTVNNVFLPTEGLEAGNYWLYTCGLHQSISENLNVAVILVEAIPETLADNFWIYPTPVANKLYFDTPYPVEQVELYNITGKPVLKVKKPAGSINVGHLPEGVYILQMITEQNRILTARIIKK